MITNESTTLLEEFCSMLLIDLLVILQTTSSFFNISPSLIQRKWQSSQLLTDFDGHFTITLYSIFNSSISPNNRCTPQQEQCTQLRRKGIDFNALCQATKCL